jgi:replicative DNA helicase Mcm
LPTYSQEKEDLKNQIDQFLQTSKGNKYVTDFISGKTKNIVIDLGDISDYQVGVAQNIIENASRYAIAAIEEAIINYIVMFYGPDKIEANQISLTGNLPLTLIHEAGSLDIGHLIRIHGLVNKTAPIHPMYVQAVFKCPLCGGESQPIVQENPWKLTVPFPKCEGCDERVVWEPAPQLSELKDSQEFTIQESYEDISSNKIPRPIRCITFKNNLMNVVNCGDDIEALCIVNAMPASQKFTKTKFNVIYLEVLSIVKRRKDPESIVFTPEEELQIKELSKDPDIYTKMIGSLAPSLYGHENEKEAVLLAIFGSPEEVREDITVRGNIHILLVGDPATAKSQLLRSAVELSPRGMYAMGRGTTAAGLTAALHKDTETGEWEISAGVLVLADEGIAAIDEIDKMREEDRVNIHEAMEQQTVSIDKAGYHIQMKARTAVIAAANPSLGRYDIYKSVFENLPKFPPSLFSRFDLIFKVLDIPNEENDMNVVTHIMENSSKKSPIDRVLLRKYIAFAKRIKPKISDDAVEALKNYFVAVRKNYTTDQKVFPFSFRQFEALKRLTLARARALLKEEADVGDVTAMKRLFDVFLKDTIGGDVTQMETGTVTSQTGLMKIMLDAFGKHDMTEADLRNVVHCDDDTMFRKAFAQLQSKCSIITKGLALNGQEVYGLTCS